MGQSRRHPNYKTGFATRDLSDAPNLWKGNVGLWAPSLGPTGLTLRDQSGFRNDGILTNMASDDWVISGNPRSPGYVLALNGSTNYVSVGNFGGGIGFTDIAILFWFKTSVGDNDFVISKDGAGNNVGDASMKIVSDKLQFFDDWTNIDVTSSANVTDGNWHHGVFTLSSTDGYRLFLDGKLVDEDATTGNTIWNNSTDLQFGTVLGGSFSFGGQLGSTSIYNRALLPSEIQHLYDKPLDMLTPRSRVFLSAGFVRPKVYGSLAHDRQGLAG